MGGMANDPSIPIPTPYEGSVRNPPSILARRTLHTGKKFDYEEITVASSKSGGAPITRQIVRHPGAVVVVAVDAARGVGGVGGVEGEKGLILIRNFRIGVEEWLFECCAGTIDTVSSKDGKAAPGMAAGAAHGGVGGGGVSRFDPREDPTLCAGRELVEETGYQASELISLGWFYTTPGLTDERMHVFVARGLVHVGQRLEEDEHIQVERVAVSEALRMIDDGRIRDGKSITAILLAARRGLLGGGTK